MNVNQWSNDNLIPIANSDGIDWHKGSGCCCVKVFDVGDELARAGMKRGCWITGITHGLLATEFNSKPVSEPFKSIINPVHS